MVFSTGTITFKNISFNMFKFKTYDRIMQSFTITNCGYRRHLKKTIYIMKEPLNNYGA